MCDVCDWELFWYEGLDSRESSHLSAKNRNNQQPQQEAAFSAPRSIFYFFHPHHRAHTRARTHTCRTEANLHAEANIPQYFIHIHNEVQKGFRHLMSGHRKLCTVTVTHFYLDSIFKEGLRHRRQGAEGREEVQTCSSHTKANPIACLLAQT